MVSLAFLLTGILEIHFYRHYARLPAGLLQEHHFEAAPGKGTVILLAVSFLLATSFFLLQGFENYQNTPTLRRHRFWRKRTASLVLAPSTEASPQPGLAYTSSSSAASLGSSSRTT